MSNIRLDLPRYFRGPVNTPDSEWLFNQAKSQAGQDLFVIAMTQGKQQGTWLEIGCGDPIRSNNTYLLEKRLAWNGISIDTQRMDTNIITPFEEYWTGFYHTVRRPNWPAQEVTVDQLPDPAVLNTMPYYQNFIHRQLTDIDRIPYAQRDWSTARPLTQFYQSNALGFDYSTVPAYCDYLQIDIHPSTHNLELLNLVLPDHRFGVITFEHDAWDHTTASAQVRMESRRMLRDWGYEMIISDATVPPGHGNGIGDEPINFEDWYVDPDIVPDNIRTLYRNLDTSGRPKYYYDTLFKIS